jgi:hypothetical protein
MFTNPSSVYFFLSVYLYIIFKFYKYSKKNHALKYLAFKRLDLALMVLQCYDLVTYYYFISKLKEGESKLLITFTKIKLLNRAKINKDIYLKSKLTFNSIDEKNLEDIIILLSNILNSTNSQKVLKEIYSYYFTKKNQESIFLANHIVVDFKKRSFLNNSLIFNGEKRFTLLFCKNFKKCSEKIYPQILYLYIKEGLLFLYQCEKVNSYLQ